MAPASKRRKVAAAPVKIGGISTFTTVSKAVTTGKPFLEQNTYLNKFATTTGDEPLSDNRKRKAVESDEDTPIIAARNIKPQRRTNPSPTTPETLQKFVSNGSPELSNSTPTKGARSLFNELLISSKTSSRSPLSTPSFSSNLDTSTPEKTSEHLPAELLDLINLHASFLTALSIHYAHNGTHSPADLRVILPDVARAWGKRRVLLEDIRRTLGLLNSNILDIDQDGKVSQLILSNYGQGKICVEVMVKPGKLGRILRPINENILNDIFVSGIKKAWIKRESESVKKFVSALPMEPIVTCSSLAKMSPLLAKGQRRLEEMKSGIIFKSQTEKPRVENVIIGPKMTLLERLRAKQLHNANLPPPPSKAELARKAALDRLDEVVKVLTILSTSSSIGQSRISFTFPTVLGKLKDSFKMPISKEEADTCVRLLCSEIAPEWIRIVKMKKMEALVVNRDERPKDAEIRERIRRTI